MYYKKFGLSMQTASKDCSPIPLNFAGKRVSNAQLII